MTTVTISGADIHSELDLHNVMAAALDFGRFYGKNLNALWDRLTTDVERPVLLIWLNAKQSRNNLGEERFRVIVDLLREVEALDLSNGYSERFVVEIRD